MIFTYNYPLKQFSEKFGAEPWVGVRFNKEGWFFLSVEDLNKTKNNFVITKETAKIKGLIFEELVK